MANHELLTYTSRTALTSTVILGSKSFRTHGHIFVSHVGPRYIAPVASGLTI
jgi:hypothetical protein